MAENAFVRWLKTRHPRAKQRKMNGIGARSWPDRQVLKPRVRAPLWIEFKREGKGPTRQQAIMHRELRAMGQIVKVAWTRDEAIRYYQEHR